MNDTFNLQRRQVLLGSAGAVASASLFGFSPLSLAAEMPLPDYVNWKNPEALIVHSANTLETRRDAIGTSIVTSNEQLFVRNNLPAPDAAIVADRDAWTVAFQGVKNPRSMTLGELKSLGVETVACVLQCSGNGRAFFPHGASGTPWSVGAAGCVFWSGVPVSAVVDALGGIGDGLEYMTSTGGETLPAGIEPKDLLVERSVPLRALEHAILAWELNGEPLPLAHGGPLRLVVPGYYGVNNIKYVKQVAFTAEQTAAKIQASGYRIRPVGQGGAPDQPSMWEMSVKSWITQPLQQAKAGRVRIQGVAFGGASAVQGVEVSLDAGKNWQMARFVGPDLGPFAWRPFVLFTELKPGSYTLASRAIDAQGAMQPQERLDNERGYGHNGWQDHAVSLVVA
ncbi:MAG: sulfite oxidase [Pseudomonas sp.]|uniref:SorT family sulfite dehydrogenase catalytic subunit n=1 Tax=Pseudomonas sp. TaxID=306 RepID=UPI00299D7EBA|nr:sulfite oxidase [Pseudomonas sp.]MDX1726172.1 sulfite oxidase [Pseudomonas sp.]